MRFLLLSIGVFALAGCLQQAPAPEPEPEPVFIPQDDACGAGALSGLIGASRATVEAMDFDQPVRIIGPNTAVTMDLNPKRLNFMLIDDEVVQITCG